MKAKIIYYTAGSLLWLLLIYLLIEVSIVHFSTPRTTQAVNMVSTPKIPTYPNQYELEIMSSEYRLSKKLNALKHDEILCNIANKRVEEIKDNFSHEGFQKYKGDNRPKGYIAIGENLVTGVDSSTTAFSSWKLSPSHNENLLFEPYISTCVKCSESYCVQLFGG